MVTILLKLKRKEKGERYGANEKRGEAAEMKKRVRVTDWARAWAIYGGIGWGTTWAWDMAIINYINGNKLIKLYNICIFFKKSIINKINYVNNNNYNFL